VARRRKKTGLLGNVSEEHITLACAVVLIILGVYTFIGDTQSIIGFQIFKYGDIVLWEYYKWILGPVSVMLWVFLLKEKDLHFNSYRAFGFLFFLVACASLVGWYDTNYDALLNLYPSLELVLGRIPFVFTGLVLLGISLFILFRISVLHLALWATALLPNASDLKASYSAERKLSKAKKEARTAKKATKKLTVEEKKMQKESTALEKQLEELRQEKEQLAKMKQPKQLHLEKQKDRKVEVKAKTSGGKISSLFWWWKAAASDKEDKKKEVPVLDIK